MNNNLKAAITAMEWYLDNGVDEALGEEPRGITPISMPTAPAVAQIREPAQESYAPTPSVIPMPANQIISAAPLAKAESRAEAVRLAAAANTLDELREAIKSFDGLDIKRTATNLVFSDGNPKAPIMLVGEAPGADEDRLGKPFVGVSGQLLDRIFKCIGVDREQDDPNRSIYIANILNWRPPGNRTPSPSEIEISLPFIERHIALVQPKLLILCGGVSAKALLGAGDSISKLRKSWRTYETLSPDIGAKVSIPAICTYHPSYLLRTPTQKKAVWEDMLTLDAKRTELGLKPE